jgi:hypothetical protein
MRPDLAHRLDDALATLAPVLAERAAQGGLRVYHESFARLLLQRIETNPGAQVCIRSRRRLCRSSAG